MALCAAMSNFVSGVLPATFWVVENSDLLAPVEKAISQLAELVPDSTNKAHVSQSIGIYGSDAGFAELFFNISQAAGYLTAQAKRHTQLSGHNTGKESVFWGIWKDDPAMSLPEIGKAVLPLRLYRDVAVLLGASGVPLWDPSSSSDIVNILGLGMFASGVSLRSTDPDDGCRYSTFGYQSRSLTIRGCHYFLPLPTSIDGRVSPVLAALCVEVVYPFSTNTALSEYAGSGLAHRTINQTWGLRDPTTRGFCVRVTMLWASARALNEIITTMLAGIRTVHPNWANVEVTLIGVYCTLNIFSGMDKPSVVLEGVLQAAAEAVSAFLPHVAPEQPASQFIIDAKVEGNFVAGLKALELK